jgi:streptogramin lyase
MLNEYATRCIPSGHLAVGSGNALWFSETCVEGGSTTSEFITRITTAGTMSLFRIGTDADPYRGLAGLIEGPDGNIWFVEQLAHAAIGRLNPTTGKYAEFLLPAPSNNPSDLFLGPDGNLWLPTLGTAFLKNMLDRIDMHGVITQFDWTGDELSTLGIGPDNSFWGADGENGVWRIELSSGGITPSKLPGKPANINAAFMTSDKNHNLWFSEYSGCALGRVDMDAIFNDDFDTCP